MKLEVHERLSLMGILPKEGDYGALKTIRRAREMISFTPEELTFYQLKTEIKDGKPSTSWNSQKAKEQIKDIPIDEYTTSVIRDKLADLNKRGKLTDETFSLYEKFVIAYK